MAIITAITGSAKNRSQMTGLTTVRGMLTNQRKISQVMVKADLVLPGDLVVA